MEASSSVNWSSPHIYTHTHQLGLSGSQHRCEIIIWPMCWQVNGLDMQVVTHHEAVSALRNAGSCIKMKVLRSRALPPELCALAEDPVIRETGLVIGKQHDPGNSSSGGGGGGGGGGGRGGGSSRPQPKQPKVEPAASDYSLSKRIEAVVMCNGNGVVSICLQAFLIAYMCMCVCVFVCTFV